MMDDSRGTIWTYLDYHDERTGLRPLVRSEECVFCGEILEVIKSEFDISGFCGDSVTHSFRIRCCLVCGWWNIRKTEFTACLGDNTDDEWGNAGILKKLDLSDQRVPIELIRSYLAARYSDRFHVNPTLFEQVVASVYRDRGYRVRVTGRSGDEGIDMILDGPNDITIGVQVKRHRRKIKVDHIHSLAGALVRKHMPAGVFITTSSYQPGAVRAAKELASTVAIELIDARQFYDALGISQRIAYLKSTETEGPFQNAPLVDLNRAPSPVDTGPYYVL